VKRYGSRRVIGGRQSGAAATSLLNCDVNSNALLEFPPALEEIKKKMLTAYAVLSIQLAIAVPTRLDFPG
jgi:hypothetical protein